MEITAHQAKEFARLLIMRGFGLYGDKQMTRICKESEISCETNGTFQIEDQKIDEAITKLMINYAKFNLPAKMTVLVLAKKHGIAIPDALKSSKNKKSKYRQRLESKT